MIFNFAKQFLHVYLIESTRPIKGEVSIILGREIAAVPFARDVPLRQNNKWTAIKRHEINWRRKEVTRLPDANARAESS